MCYEFIKHMNSSCITDFWTLLTLYEAKDIWTSKMKKVLVLRFTGLEGKYSILFRSFFRFFFRLAAHCVDLLVRIQINCFCLSINSVCHDVWKQEKCSYLEPPRGNLYNTQLAGQGLKITRFISIFNSKKVWKFLKKDQLTKSDPKKTRG